MIRPSLVLVFSTVLAGCAAPPATDPPAPATGLTEADRFFAAPDDAPRPGPDDLRWWRRFDDPALAGWVERALQANPDLQLSRARADEARALLRVAMAARAPRLDAQARVDASDRRDAGGRRVAPSVALAFDWDADLWGALRWAERSAAASALRSEHLTQAMRLSIASLAARAYIALREAQQAEHQLTDEQVLLREIARLVQVRVDAGLSPRLDSLRARGELAAVEAEAVAAAEAVRSATRALQLLAGERPGAALDASVFSARRALPTLAGALPLALPIDLLRLRPDLRAAEQALRAARAELGVAEASRHPQLRLPGALVLGTSSGGALLARLGAEIAIALSAPLSDGGRLAAQRDAAQSRVDAAGVLYRRTLQQALAEVESALTAVAAVRGRIAAQQRAVSQAEGAVQQSRTLYTAGLAGFIDVLDAQRTALDRRQALLRMQGDAARAQVATFEAMGLIDRDASAQRASSPQ